MTINNFIDNFIHGEHPESGCPTNPDLLETDGAVR